MTTPYCTLAQLENFYDVRQLGQLSNDANSRTAENDKLQALLDAAGDEVDSYLTGQYTVPVTNSTGGVPPIITRATAMLAVFSAYMRRGSIPDAIQAEADRIRKWLKDVSTRAQGIPDVGRVNVPRLVASESADGTSRFDPGARNFDRLPTQTSASRGKAGY